MGAIGGGIKLVMLIVIIGICLYIYSAGKTARDAYWQPIYNDLNERYTKTNSDLRILEGQAMAQTATINADLAMVGKDSEINYAKLQSEVDARVERYLNKLARMRGNEGQNSLHAVSLTAGTLSSLTGTLGATCDGKAKLNRDLRFIDRGIAKRILAVSDKAVTALIVCRSYVQDLEAEMKPLRKKYLDNLATIEDSQDQ